MGDYSDIEHHLAGQLFKSNYQDLMKIARYRRRRGMKSSTLDTIDILHESYLKLEGKAGWVSRKHFINAAALAMRQVVVDHARRKNASKRGEGMLSLSDDAQGALMPEFWETPEQLVQVSDLLEKLKDENPKWMRIFDARYFSGYTEDETAEILGMSSRTVRRDWRLVREWMTEMIGVK